MSDTKSNDWGLNLVILASILATVFLVYLAILGHQPVGVLAASKNDTLAQRIRPVVTLDDIRGSDKMANQAGMAQAAAKSPEELYLGACMACHTTGVAEAPKLGDNAAWSTRAAMGVDGLLASAIKGKGAMPPKGASAYSDDELRTVIEYMLAESGL